MTKQRQLVLDIVTNFPGHPTAEEVYATAREQMPSISLGTVYRNLGVLCQQHMIRHIPMEEGPGRYDRPHIRHDHLVCIGCGKVEDVFMEDLSPLIEKEAGKAILSYEMNARFLCNSCKEKNPVD